MLCQLCCTQPAAMLRSQPVCQCWQCCCRTACEWPAFGVVRALVTAELWRELRVPLQNGCVGNSVIVKCRSGPGPYDVVFESMN